ncbi:MAG: hypothetical protein IJS15_03620, partial [Victivallales bacterium]|nr:hypothetical protein [Victivallales bacterium]
MKMESNLENVKNEESKEENMPSKAAKVNLNWFDSKSVQQLSDRLAAIVKDDKRKKEPDSQPQKADLKGLTEENKRGIENLFSMT